MILCDSCESISVNSSPLIDDKDYDIKYSNRRIVICQEVDAARIAIAELQTQAATKEAR